MYTLTVDGKPLIEGADTLAKVWRVFRGFLQEFGPGALDYHEWWLWEAATCVDNYPETSQMIKYRPMDHRYTFELSRIISE